MSWELDPEDTPDAQGRYANQGDVEDIFGIENIRQWSNLDNTSTDADVSRIQRAIEDAEEAVDEYFLGSAFGTPLSLTTGSPRVRWWVAVKAGVYLYSARGSRDQVDGEGSEDMPGRYSKLIRAVEKSMLRSRSNPMSFGAAFAVTPTPTVPVVL